LFVQSVSKITGSDTLGRACPGLMEPRQVWR